MWEISIHYVPLLVWKMLCYSQRDVVLINCSFRRINRPIKVTFPLFFWMLGDVVWGLRVFWCQFIHVGSFEFVLAGFVLSRMDWVIAGAKRTGNIYFLVFKSRVHLLILGIIYSSFTRKSYSCLKSSLWDRTDLFCHILYGPQLNLHLRLFMCRVVW